MTRDASLPPITVALMGGLGNQLFQFATGLQVARNASTDLVLDLAWFHQRYRRSGGVVLRPFELSEIASGVPVAALPPPGMASLARHSRDVLLRRLPTIKRGPLSHLVYERSATFDPTVLDLAPGAHLSGYFASWRYFPDVADGVRSRVLAGKDKGNWVTEQSRLMTEEGAIALHVRRGDYLALQSTYGHVTPSYYSRALKLIAQCGHDGPVWLFSDEPDAAQAWLSDDVVIDRVVQPPQGAQAVDSLIVMSSARALAIANSTFSWWAAFLQDAPGRTVVAPRPAWANASSPEPRDALLPHWATVDCRNV